ncbi:hypothetical protein [Thermomonas sp.]|uniref:hypothetical protein n=1 Tax=Thermomonas sp. TaxID=1971895 RepID=UPI002487A3A2|nr:hypothetical protein [Thermomonas sp.]MDI1251667.1 hypothetical protein [Thermomonas sp.]
MINDYLATKPKVLSGIVPYVLICSGEVDRGFALSQSAPTNNDSLLLSGLFSGEQPEVLPTPAFTKFVLTDYWDELGRSNSCRKNDAGEYVCK